jgi:hypothetical protein
VLGWEVVVRVASPEVAEAKAPAAANVTGKSLTAKGAVQHGRVDTQRAAPLASNAAPSSTAEKQILDARSPQTGTSGQSAAVVPALLVAEAGQPLALAATGLSDVTQAPVAPVKQALSENPVPLTGPMAGSALEKDASIKTGQKNEAHEAPPAKGETKAKGVGHTGVVASPSSAVHLGAVPTATGAGPTGAVALAPPVQVLPAHTNATHVPMSAPVRRTGPDVGVGAHTVPLAGSHTLVAAEARNGALPPAVGSTVERAAATPAGTQAIEQARVGEPKQPVQNVVAGQTTSQQSADPTTGSGAGPAQSAAGGPGSSAPTAETAGSAHVQSATGSESNTSGGTTAAHPGIPSAAGQGGAAVPATAVAAGSVAGGTVAGGVGAPGVRGATPGQSGQVAGMVGSAARSDVAAINEPHRTLVATPTTLEVGVPNGTEGWLRVRAQVGEQGQVNASVAAGSSAGQEMLHRELPALNAYLHSEQMTVTTTVAERSFAASGGGSMGTADDAGRAMSANAGSTNGGGTGGQQSDPAQRGPSGSFDVGDALRGHNGAGLGESGHAHPSLDGQSGRWLNVQA